MVPRAVLLEEVQQDLAVRVRRPLRLELGVVAFQILLELLVVVDLAVDGKGRVSVLRWQNLFVVTRGCKPRLPLRKVTRIENITG